MRTAFTMALLAITVPAIASAQDAPSSQPMQAQIDYDGFAQLTEEVAAYRTQRLINLEDFNQRAANKDAIILDTRSAKAFAAGHIKGAINLPFSDFTDDKLRKVIGKNADRQILIYCNNNFNDNVTQIPLKSAPLALNIPTFINLYGYGYRNIYELKGRYFLADPAIAWTGERPIPLSLVNP